MTVVKSSEKVGFYLLSMILAAGLDLKKLVKTA